MTLLVQPAPPTTELGATSVAGATWVSVCPLEDLVPDRGVAALVGPWQVAVFRVMPDDALYAIANHDPFSRANVLSRGIVGSRGDAPKVASPMYKQSFDLRTGICLDDDTVAVPTFPVRVVDGMVEVSGMVQVAGAP